MSNKIGFLILGLTMISSLILAQESIIFKQSVLPNSIYKSSMQTVIDSETIFGVDSTSENSSLGMEPILSNGLTLMFYSISSGENFEGKIPAVMEYDSLVSQQSTGMGGEPMEMVLFKGTKIYGNFDEMSSFSLDSIVGDVDENMRATLAETLKQFSKSILFPEDPIKIGGEFSQEIPFSIPLPGKSPMEMKIKTIYTLTEIKEGMAYFDLVQEYIMESQLDELGDMKMTGAGNGTLEFDIENNYTTIMETTSKSELLMKVGEMNVLNKSNTKIEIITELTRK